MPHQKSSGICACGEIAVPNRSLCWMCYSKRRKELRLLHGETKRSYKENTTRQCGVIEAMSAVDYEMSQGWEIEEAVKDLIKQIQQAKKDDNQKRSTPR